MFSKIIGFFSGVPLPVWGGIAALALITGTVWYCDGQVDERVEQAEELGAVTERNEQLEQTLENVEKANEASEEIDVGNPDGDLPTFCQCVRSTRTPTNCERFLPSGETFDSGSRWCKDQSR